MRASARTAVNVLGLLFLWAIFSVAGQREMTTPAMVEWTIAGAAATVACGFYFAGS